MSLQAFTNGMTFLFYINLTLHQRWHYDHLPFKRDVLYSQIQHKYEEWYTWHGSYISGTFELV